MCYTPTVHIWTSGMICYDICCWASQASKIVELISSNSFLATQHHSIYISLSDCRVLSSSEICVCLTTAVMNIQQARLQGLFKMGAPRIRTLAEGREAGLSALPTPGPTPTPSIASADAEDIEMEDVVLEDVNLEDVNLEGVNLEVDESEDTETAVHFKARLIHWIRQMMFVSGETAEPSAETTWMIEEIVREQVIEMVWGLHNIQHPLTASASTSDSPCQPTWLQIHLHRRPDLPNPTQHRQGLPPQDVPLLEGRAKECQRLR